MKTTLTVMLTSILTVISSNYFPILTFVLAGLFFWVYCGVLALYIYYQLDSNGNRVDNKCGLLVDEIFTVYALGAISLVGVLLEDGQIKKLFNKWNIEKIEFRKPFIIKK